MRMRHGVPEIEMKDDLLRYISHILAEAPLAIFYYSKRQVYYSKRVLPCCRCFEFYYGKEAGLVETS